MSSVQSGHVGRDEHVQLPDYFDSVHHPMMVFESASVDVGDSDEDWVVDGRLTVKATTQPLRLAARMTGQRDSPLDGQQHTGFVANGRLSRLAFGVAAEVPLDLLG